jgi:N,N-dimethylformamidase
LKPQAKASWPILIRPRKSIAFSQSLPYNNFDNDISKLPANVENAFSSRQKLPGWAWSAEEKQWR